MSASGFPFRPDTLPGVPWDNTQDTAQQEPHRNTPQRRRQRRLQWRVALITVVAMAWASYERHYPSWDEDVHLSEASRMVDLSARESNAR